ncbi:hypothetical protein [Ammoniphilus sp. YIM 78166]|nr:hypothetical protein [Ammoniphilus sp. YIM 78166]
MFAIAPKKAVTDEDTATIFRPWAAPQKTSKNHGPTRQREA